MTQKKYFTYLPDGLDQDGQGQDRQGQSETKTVKLGLANSPAALVSVIVPIYNAEAYLDQALDSIENQTHKNLEIICINDGSTDNSLEIIQKHAAKDPRIIVVDKKNEGYGAGCNSGLDTAHGEWISIVEPDDWIEPNMYKDMLEFASQFTESIDIIKTPYTRVVNPDTPQEKHLKCSYAFRIFPKKQPFEISEQTHLLKHHPSIWSAIYRRSFLEEHNIRFKPIPGAGWADNPFLIETLCQAKNIIYLNKAYYNYRADTTEKETAFAIAHPEIPFDRWHEMLDIIERLGITDEHILAAHYNRGFLYMSGVIERNDPDSPEMRERLAHMFERMDTDIVLKNTHISPGCKRLFAEIRDIENPKISELTYVANLGEQTLNNLITTGPVETFGSIMLYLRARKARTGGR